MSYWLFTTVIVLQCVVNICLIVSNGASDRRLKHIEDALWLIEKERREVGHV